jgi:hypothetical protein
MADNLHKYTVQEATNLLAVNRIIKLQPTMTADDNADNDVAFEWTEIPLATSSNGKATKLTSISFLDADDSAGDIEFVFCKGSDEDGTAPTAAQGLVGGAGTGSAAVDITAAEAQAVQICGNVVVTRNEGDLILAQLASKGNINLLLQPGTGTTSLYVGGIWRSEPAATGGTGTLDVYFGFEG